LHQGIQVPIHELLRHVQIAIINSSPPINKLFKFIHKFSICRVNITVEGRYVLGESWVEGMEESTAAGQQVRLMGKCYGFPIYFKFCSNPELY
jgi:hypothetical protein